MNKRKEFSKLNLLDRFLFYEAMEDSENMKTVLDIILGQDIPLRLPPHSEKEMRTFPDNRQVRLDVYAWDDEILCTIQKRRRKIQRIFPNAAASIRRYWTVICYRLEALISIN